MASVIIINAYLINLHIHLGSLNFFSLVTFPIEVIGSNGQVCSKATGFFHSKSQENIYLVTNWHVVTGRDINDPSKSKNGVIPTHIKCILHGNVGDGLINKQFIKELIIPINDKNGNSPKWCEHPKLKYQEVKATKDRQVHKVCTVRSLTSSCFQCTMQLFFGSPQREAFEGTNLNLFGCGSFRKPSDDLAYLLFLG